MIRSTGSRNEIPVSRGRKAVECYNYTKPEWTPWNITKFKQRSIWVWARNFRRYNNITLKKKSGGPKERLWTFWVGPDTIVRIFTKNNNVTDNLPDDQPRDDVAYMPHYARVKAILNLLLEMITCVMPITRSISILGIFIRVWIE